MPELSVDTTKLTGMSLDTMLCNSPPAVELCDVAQTLDKY